MIDELVATNGRLVAPDSVIEGTLRARNGRIVEVAEGRSHVRGALDLEGDWLLPGLVELHTDNLERQFSPRPGVRWPADAAMLIHDAQVAQSGITTVGDAVCVGFHGGKSERLEYLRFSIDVLRRARGADALKADHFLHLRLELTDPHLLELFEPLLGEPALRLVSLMDHTPGQRQWHDLERFRSFSLGRGVRTDAEFEELVGRRVRDQRLYADRQRAEVLRLLDAHPAVRASHDDATAEHVALARRSGCSLSEFPTTLAAAEAARAAGMGIVMGAPNLIIGGSHSGNVAAADLVERGLVDVLSSDYVPASLLHAAFLLHEGFGVPMPDAIAPMTRAPADQLGLTDRGRLAPGMRADLLQVREIGTTPAVVRVWLEGRRIA